MEIDAPKLSEILPASLTADKKIVAAAQYLDEELAKLSGAIKQVLHLPRLDELESDVLDHLAWQYHVDNYGDFSEEIKRKMIRESIYLHRIKGTKAAVLLALTAFSDKPEVKEWFEYGGEEFFFKVLLHDLKDVGDDGETLLRTIYDSKNVRSWLEEIRFDYSAEDAAKRYVGAIEAEGGDELTDLSSDETCNAEIFHALFELEGGDELTDFDFELEPATSALSGAIFELEGGIEITGADLSPPDERPDEEEFPDQDFLRLYFGFPNDSIRTVTLLNPRNPIWPIEIKNLGKFSADKKILLNSKGLITDGIRRALLIVKHVETIL